MRTIIFLFSVSVLFFQSRGQGFEQDMQAVYKSFIAPEHISFDIQYVLRSGAGSDARVISESKGRYLKSKNRYISVFDSKATVVTPREVIMIDEEDKRIRVKKLKESIDNTIDFLEQLKEFNKSIERTERELSSDGRNVTYRVILKSTDLLPIRQYDICISSKTHLISRLTLYYKKPLEKDEDYKLTGNEIPRLDITFSGIETGKPASSRDLDPAYYYSVNKSQLSPTNNFKGYEIKEVF